MDPDPDSYVKASDFDLAKQRDNRRAFVRSLRRHRGRAALLVALCSILAVAALVVPGSASEVAGEPWRRVALAGLSIAVAIYLAIAAFRPQSSA